MNLLIETIESDRYPLSPLVRVLKNILTKFGELGGLSPELAQRPRRYAPATPAPRMVTLDWPASRPPAIAQALVLQPLDRPLVAATEGAFFLLIVV